MSDLESPPQKRQKLSESIRHLSASASLKDSLEIWSRAQVPHLEGHSLTFQQIDAEETANGTVVRLFGVTDNGNSIMCDIIGFMPYFYVPAPQGFQTSDIQGLISDLRRRDTVFQELESVVVCMKKSLFKYTSNENVPFLKLVAKSARVLGRMRLHFEQGVQSGDFVFSNITYDNISYPLRCTIDCGIQGMSWITLPAESYTLTPPSHHVSRAQIEVRVHYTKLEAHQPEGEWLKSSALRILSFDIECAGRKGKFPEAEIDPIIQIANCVQVQGQPQPFVRNVFTLGTCLPIVGAQVIESSREPQMLLKWRDFVNAVDPDIIIGYNVNNFDLPYMIDRARHLDLKEFPFFGRLKDTMQTVRASNFSSKAFGTLEGKETNIEGRVTIDMLQYIRREYKLRAYSLNAVSSHFLGEQKEDVHHSIITELFNGTSDTRYRLAVYCLKDAHLPLQLLNKLMALINMTEMARVTGVPLSYLLSRGQQIKVVSQLFRKALEVNMVVPNFKQQGSADEQYEGATVIEPRRGYYSDPIATLDFSSLYPSIMMAHNLCYTTLIDKDTIERLQLVLDEDYEKTPNGDLFVTSKVRHGLLPIILNELLTARKRAKADLKKETDPFKRAVLDGRQLALKISANSVYGFTGATVGKLPCLEISSSVTAYGRRMIEETKNTVETHYTTKNGYSHDATVIYGDTDSVMVKFGSSDLKECMKLGEEAAALVSKRFKNPINLEFEKVYFPYLLINKKRYAGLYWTRPEAYDKMDTKGIETVRRDNCRLVQNVVETCLHRILIDRDPGAAESFVKEVLADLLQNRVDLSLLVITKQLTRSDYAGKQAHVELAERMRKRDAGSAPNLGDRVAYVIIRKGPNEKNYEKSEDPLYVLEQNIPIDTNYYLENQLSKPLLRIFEPIMGEQRAKQMLRGAHTRTITVATPKTGGLMKFAVKTELCKGCKRPLTGALAKGAVCAACRPRLPELYCAALQNVNELQVKYARLWTHFSKQSLLQDVICGSKDSPIFYMRHRAQKELLHARQELAKFDIVEW